MSDRSEVNKAFVDFMAAFGEDELPALERLKKEIEKLIEKVLKED